MDKTLKEKLQSSYPDVYGQCKRWSISGGWYQILDDLGQKLSTTPASITGLNEKFGSLDIDFKGSNQAAEAAVERASELSEATCELCGEPGSIDTKAQWFKARCDTCRREEARK